MVELGNWYWLLLLSLFVRWALVDQFSEDIIALAILRRRSGGKSSSRADTKEKQSKQAEGKKDERNDGNKV
jgi:hypothetical protein